MVSPLRTEGFLMDAWPTPPSAKELAPGLNWRRLREICTWLLAVWPGSLFGDYDFVLATKMRRCEPFRWERKAWQSDKGAARPHVVARSAATWRSGRHSFLPRSEATFSSFMASTASGHGRLSRISDFVLRILTHIKGTSSTSSFHNARFESESGGSILASTQTRALLASWVIALHENMDICRRVNDPLHFSKVSTPYDVGIGGET